MKQKNLSLVVIILANFLCQIPMQAQPKEGMISAEGIIKQVLATLEQYPAISYTYTRETKYHADNYENKWSAFFYMEKYEPSIIGMRFQAKRADLNTIFNGKQILNLDLKKLTIDSSSVTAKNIKGSSSYLYNSYAMLMQCLPIVLKDSGFNKSIADTIIKSKQYWKLSFEKANSYFGLYSGLETFEKKIELRRPYELIIDKTSFLPKLFISKYIRGNDGRDFVKMVYENVQTNPKPPAKQSWEYSFYTKNYAPYIPEIRKEEVKTGTVFTGFTLNEYLPNSNQKVSFSKYKGKLILLEFWFKSCGPCMEAMPQYNNLQSSFPQDSFQLITINVEDKKEDIAFFYKKYLPNYPMLYNGANMFKELGFNGCPTALLISKEGLILKKYQGFNALKLKKDIADALK
jgi:thiol-disulfide isomerase/thioredoxin